MDSKTLVQLLGPGRHHFSFGVQAIRIPQVLMNGRRSIYAMYYYFLQADRFGFRNFGVDALRDHRPVLIFECLTLALTA
jgi:hypothetical protein